MGQSAVSGVGVAEVLADADAETLGVEVTDDDKATGNREAPYTRKLLDRVVDEHRVEVEGLDVA